MYDRNSDSNSKNKFIVAIYIRVSTPSQAKEGKFSLEIQERESIKYARAQKWNVFGVYKDVLSGYLEYEIRDGGSRLLSDAKDGKFNLVLFWDNDRNGRDPEAITAKLFRHEMRINGVQVTSVSQPTILKDPNEFKYEPFDEGQIFMETIHDLQSSMTVSKFRKRSMDGKLERIKNGKMINTPPYGYKLEALRNEDGEIVTHSDKRIISKREINIIEAPYVIRIYNEYINKGMSMNQICDSLNRDCIPTRKGKPWERATVKRILTNPVYYGALYYNRYFRRKNALNGTSRYGKNPVDRWVIVPPDRTEHPSIISEEVFNKAQEIRLAKIKLGAVAVYNDYLFSGLLRCGICNGKYHSKKFINRYRRKTDGIVTRSIVHGYICSNWARYKNTDKNYISEELVEKAIINDIKKYKDNPQVLKSFIQSKNNKMLKNLADRITLVNRNLEKTKMRRKRMMILYQHSNISEDEYLKEIDSINLEAENMEDDRARLVKEHEDENKREVGRKGFLMAINNFEEVFRQGNSQVKKAFLRSLVSDIVIKKHSIRINYIL